MKEIVMKIDTSLIIGDQINPNLVLPKPNKTFPEKDIAHLEATRQLIKTRKRDGHSGVVLIGGWQRDHIQFCTASMADATAKFPHLVDAYRTAKLPYNTIMRFEAVVVENGLDSREKFHSLNRASVTNALAIQKEGTLGSHVLIDILQIEDQPVFELSAVDRLYLIQELHERIMSAHVECVTPLPLSLTDAQTAVRACSWEGLVLQRHDAPSMIGTNGETAKPPRLPDSWKWKPVFEDDFVAYGWIPSTAKSHPGAVKDILIGQYHPETGELTSFGKTSSGLSRIQRHELANDNLYPFVLEIEYKQRFQSGKLDQAKISRIHTDKTPEACLIPEQFLA